MKMEMSIRGGQWKRRFERGEWMDVDGWRKVVNDMDGRVAIFVTFEENAMPRAKRVHRCMLSCSVLTAGHSGTEM